MKEYTVWVLKIITFDAGPSSVFSGSEHRRPEPSITFGKYKVTSTLQGTRISRSGCVLSSDCKVYGQFIRQNVWSSDEETEAVKGFGLPRAEAERFADFPAKKSAPILGYNLVSSERWST